MNFLAVILALGLIVPCFGISKAKIKIQQAVEECALGCLCCSMGSCCTYAFSAPFLYQYCGKGMTGDEFQEFATQFCLTRRDIDCVVGLLNDEGLPEGAAESAINCGTNVTFLGAFISCVSCLYCVTTLRKIHKLQQERYAQREQRRQQRLEANLHNDLPDYIQAETLQEISDNNQGLRRRIARLTQNLIPEPAYTGEVRDSAGPQEQQPRFYNRSSIENWRRRPASEEGTTDPRTSHSMARFIELLKENDAIHMETHTALWTELYSLGAALGLPQEKVEEVVHNFFPQDYPELVEVIEAFEQALAGSVSAPASQTMA